MISVIIPTYNRPSLVVQAVESVLAQRGAFQFQILVIDDGSRTDTEASLQRHRGAITYVRQDNAGLNPARNHGLALATGDYIALLDDDDVWLPFKTQALLAALRAFPDAGFAHSNFFIWRPDSKARRPDGLRSWFPRPFAWDEMYGERVTFAAIPDADSAPRSMDAYFGDLYYWSLFAPMVLPSTAIIRRAALEGLRFPEVDSVGDWEFFARLSHRAGAVFVPHETTLNRSHEDPVRLTRVDPSLRLNRRLGLLQRLWRQDAAFMASHAEAVAQVETECLRRLTRLAIAGGDQASARQWLREMRTRTSFGLKDCALWGLARAPFASSAVRLARALRKPMASGA